MGLVQKSHASTRARIPPVKPLVGEKTYRAGR